MIVLVTGSRHARDTVHGPIIRQTLLWITGPAPPPHDLWEGSCAEGGVDIIARTIIAEAGWPWGHRPFAADWPTCDPDWRDPIGKCRPCTPSHREVRADGKTEYCPIAGFRRNQMMVDQLLLADVRKVCVAFPIPARGSHGTADCLTRAWRAGIPTMVIPLRPA